ncbi:TPA: WYL domain-containing protein [Vibrio parahaemolyticus]
MGVFGFLGWIFTPKKKMREVMSNPDYFKDYVSSKGYSKKEQIEFCERFGIDYEQVTGSHLESKKETKTRAINNWEKKLTVLWAGDELPLDIQYEDSDGNLSIRKITPEQVLFSKTGEFYIRGLCHRRQEQRTFNVGAILKMNREDGTETDFHSWCVASLDIDPITAVPKGRLSNFYEIIWKGTCPLTTFTYRDNGRVRVTVTPTALRKRGKYYDLVARDESGQLGVFFAQNIETMLATEGHKKKHFDDWVKEVLLQEKVCA